MFSELAKDTQSWSKTLRVFPGLYSVLCKVRELFTGPSSLLTPIASSGVSKTTLMFDNLLEGPTELTEGCHTHSSGLL